VEIGMMCTDLPAHRDNYIRQVINSIYARAEYLGQIVTRPIELLEAKFEIHDSAIRNLSQQIDITEVIMSSYTTQSKEYIRMPKCKFEV
jgi:hypothetical protein